ncbi:MAG: hypothetical protein RML46_12530 [Anaerolineae bacterium]|nr:hypothetical protein [Anaerolineae bacterium]
MLVGGDLLLEYVQLYRSVWLKGRLGGGKTSLAVYIARYLQSRGYKFISNIPVEGAIRLPSAADFSRAVVLLDEAADFLDAYEFKSELAASFKYLRHYDLVVLLPCTDPVHRRLRKLVVERVFRLEALLPVPPIWLYRFWVGPSMEWPGRKAIGGHFLFLPNAVFGRYASTHGGRGVTTVAVLRALRQALVEGSENIIAKELVIASEDVQYSPE